MADIVCAKCGEPWDAMGVRDASDMTRWESDRFLKGEGCPCCKFGTECTNCNGTGIEYSKYPHECKICDDKGYVAAWSPAKTTPPYQVGELYTGFLPKVIHINAEVHENPITLGVRKFPKRDGGHMSRDGYVEEWWVQCPEGCASKEHCPCPSCDGKGTLASSDEDLELAAARSEINASDEDPFDILERRGLEMF